MSGPEMFAVAYSEYPKHVARKAAEKAWSKLQVDEETFAVILKAILIQKRTIWLGKELQYVPHFATWLNGERWTDEVDYEQFESKSDAIARTNHENAEAVRQSFRGAVGDDAGDYRG